MARFAFVTVAVSAMISASFSAALEVTAPVEGDMVKADRYELATCIVLMLERGSRVGVRIVDVCRVVCSGVKTYHNCRVCNTTCSREDTEASYQFVQ